ETINDILYKSRESFTNFTEIRKAIEQRANLTPQEKSWLLKFLYEKEELDNLTLQQGEKHYCSLCNHHHYSTIYCDNCMKELLRNGFEEWTSGNQMIDQFIQRCQMEKPIPKFIIEWIPFEDFTGVQFKTRGGFGEIYTATWKRGRIFGWDKGRGAFIRQPNISVVLKSLFQKPDEDFFKVAETHLSMKGDTRFIVECYGLSRNPTTGNFIIVMAYMEQGDLRNYLHKHAETLTWKEKLMIISQLSNDLSRIHQKGLIHGDLHSGNILRSNLGTNRISDLGFCGPPQKLPPGSVFGIIPYMAPEVLRGGPLTEKADIYSLGMIMWEITAGCPPFLDRAHDVQLMIEICDGVRPLILSGTLETYAKLMRSCWHSDKDQRPSASEVKEFADSALKKIYIESSSSSSSTSSEEKITENLSVTTPSIKFERPTQNPSAFLCSQVIDTHSVSSQFESRADSLSVKSIGSMAQNPSPLLSPTQFQKSHEPLTLNMIPTPSPLLIPIPSPSSPFVSSPTASITANSYTPKSRATKLLPFMSFDESDDEDNDNLAVEEKSLPIPTVEQKKQQPTNARKFDVSNHSLNSTESSNLHDSNQTSSSQNESKSVELQFPNNLEEHNNSSLKPRKSPLPSPLNIKQIQNSINNDMHKLNHETSVQIPLVSSPRIAPTNAAPTIDNRRRGSSNVLPPNPYGYSVGTSNEINAPYHPLNSNPMYHLLSSPTSSQPDISRRSSSSHRGSVNSQDSPLFGPALPRMYQPPPNNNINNRSRSTSVVSSSTIQSSPLSPGLTINNNNITPLQQFILNEAEAEEHRISNDPAEEMNKLIKELDRARPKPPKMSWKANDAEDSEYQYEPPSPGTNNEVIDTEYLDNSSVASSSNAAQSRPNIHETLTNANASTQSSANTNHLNAQTSQNTEAQHYRNTFPTSPHGTILIPQHPPSSPHMQFNQHLQYQQTKRTSAPVIMTINSANPGMVPHAQPYAPPMMYHPHPGMLSDFRMQPPLDVVSEQVQSSSASINTQYTDPGELPDNTTVGRAKSSSDKNTKIGLRAKFGVFTALEARNSQAKNKDLAHQCGETTTSYIPKDSTKWLAAKKENRPLCYFALLERQIQSKVNAVAAI
ncbi:6882_t:CDS:10, partial [Ambispora gerdemannii]